MTTRGTLTAVTKSYGRHVGVRDVTLAVGTGEVVGLVGPNGAGKSTLLRLFAGLLRPTAGRVNVAGNGSQPAVRYFAGEHTLPPGVPARRWLRLWSAPATPAATNRRLGTLSRGTRQRVGLEATLVGPAPLLVLLDEPWEGLDPDASRWLSDYLMEWRAAGAGILLSSHRIHDLADICDRCLFLVNGRLAPESIDASTVGLSVPRAASLFAAFDRTKITR